MKLPLLPVLLLAACGGPIGDGDGIVDEDEIPGPGWVAELVGLHHDVGGVATIVDEDTIELTELTYDGGGINSQWFLLPDGGTAGDGFSVSDNQVGTVYDDDVLTLTLPDEVAFEDFNLISLWCVPARASFGEGVFYAPE